MSTLFWDCQTGISGDMAVASLLDLGASEEAVRAALAPLAGEGFELHVGRVEKAGLDCCDFDVALDEEHDGHDHDMAYLYDPEWTPGGESVAGGAACPCVHGDGASHTHGHHHRSYAQVREVLASLDLAPRARSLSEKAFRLLAQAESKAHGVPVDEVHFHGVGAIDAIAEQRISRELFHRGRCGGGCLPGQPWRR